MTKQSLKPRVIVELEELTDSCFVIMPFDRKFQEEYKDVISPAIEGQGLKCVRADEIKGNNSLMTDIWNKIRSCKIALAELTGKNPNVLYEIGLAHALGKPVILVTRNIKDVPSDLRHIRYLFYDVNLPSWNDNLKLAIATTIQSIEGCVSEKLHGICCKNHTPIPLTTKTERRSLSASNDICGNWNGKWEMIGVTHEIVMHIFNMFDSRDYTAISYVTIHGTKGSTKLQQILTQNCHNKTDIAEFNGANYSFQENENEYRDYFLDVIEIKSHEDTFLKCTVRDNVNKNAAELILSRVVM